MAQVKLINPAFCLAGTEGPCSEHDGGGNCQLCPSDALASSKSGSDMR